MRRGSLLLTCFAAFGILLLNSGPAAADTLDEIRSAIEESGARWQAGHTAVSDLSIEEKKRLCGFIEEPLPAERYVDITPRRQLPESFDWRDQEGENWMSEIGDQAACGSCTAFASVGALEAMVRIYEGNPLLEIDLSEQHLFSCAAGSCNYGLSFPVALGYLKFFGTPDEECAPYREDDHNCDLSCSDWRERAVKIAGWSWTWMSIPKIKEAVMQGPLMTHMTIYEDFGAYQGGVYDHTYGGRLGAHAVVLVGWHDDLECWIGRNSWSDQWGYEGYFFISWKNRVRFGNTNILISYDPTQPGACGVQSAPGQGHSSLGGWLLVVPILMIPAILIGATGLRRRR